MHSSRVRSFLPRPRGPLGGPATPSPGAGAASPGEGPTRRSTSPRSWMVPSRSVTRAPTSADSFTTLSRRRKSIRNSKPDSSAASLPSARATSGLSR